MCLGLALLVTVLPVGTRPGVALFAPRAATGARIAAAAFFLVAAAALAELRGRRPDLGCGCFGDFSTHPASRRSIARAVLLTGAALISVESPALYLPSRGHGALLFLGIVCAELALIASLSPEVSEALVRLGYTDPCELRQVPAGRTLAALRRSRTWRRHAQDVAAEMPTDMWRELCWRYVVFPCRQDGGTRKWCSRCSWCGAVRWSWPPSCRWTRTGPPAHHAVPCPRRTGGVTGLCSDLPSSTRKPRKLDIRPDRP